MLKFIGDISFLNEKTIEILKSKGKDPVVSYIGAAIYQLSRYSDINETKFKEYIDNFKKYLKNKYPNEDKNIDLVLDNIDLNYYKFFKASLD